MFGLYDVVVVIRGRCRGGEGKSSWWGGEIQAIRLPQSTGVAVSDWWQVVSQSGGAPSRVPHRVRVCLVIFNSNPPLKRSTEYMTYGVFIVQRYQSALQLLSISYNIKNISTMELNDRSLQARNAMSAWFTGRHVPDDIARQAFEAAKAQIASELQEKDRDIILRSRSASMQDFLATLLEARSKYESRRSGKAFTWLERLSSRVMHYATVLDVLVQQNPEYVSLVWGSFKFLFSVSGLHCSLPDLKRL